MIRNVFRPWGYLEPMLKLIDSKKWNFFGAVATEDRCISAIEILNKRGELAKSLLLQVEDGDSRFRQEVLIKTQRLKKAILSYSIREQDFLECPLLEGHGRAIDKFDAFLSSAVERNLVVDISCVPKKFFFIFLRKALERDNFDNIVVTYTEPDKYCSEPLAENHSGWQSLPGFLPPRITPDKSILIIALGFEVLGLPTYYRSESLVRAEKKMLFPFPASPANVSRNWDFVRQLEHEQSDLSRIIERIDANNVPDIYDKLEALTGKGDKHAILAPFGPKTMSLAMCLYASAYANSKSPPSVFYTQPTVYNPNYSSGVKSANGHAAVHAYWVRLNGKNLYSA
jgi:hypothetical protein